MVNGNNIMCVGGAMLLLFGMIGTGWTFTPVKTYNRPKPLMDYVPQEIARFDTLYRELSEMDCRGCHGSSLADRMHYSELGLTGLCTPCHAIISTPPYVELINDCTTVGCHSGSDLGPLDVAGTPPNGWHHYTDESYTDQCIACHDPGVLDRVVDDEYVPFAQYPPSVVTPSPFSCENCHWEQPVIANTLTIPWQNGDPQANNPYGQGEMAKAGHPSTFDHNDPYTAYQMNGSTSGFWNDYYEYNKKIESNFDTHHMLFNGNVWTDCTRCHAVDPDDPDYIDPYNEELIRYCETCHDVATLHAIEPHVGTGGTGDPPAVNGWEAAGFHLPDVSNTDTTDVAPTVYRNFSANEQCYGCHADDLPTWIPDAPVSQPQITDITPEIGACDVYVTLTGNYFGDVHTADRDVWIKSTSGGVYSKVPVMSWTSTQIEFQIPCWVYSVGNYKVVVDTETGPASNVIIFTLKSGGSVDSISPTTGACREIITVNGTDFDGSQDVIGGSSGTFGVYKMVQVVSSAGTFQATAYGAWSPTTFKFRMGDLFEDTDMDFIRDAGEPLLKQCEYLALGTYSVYVRSIYYEDMDTSGGYTNGDVIHQITTSDPEYFTLEDTLAVYAVYPNQIERSHYCEIMGDAQGNEDNVCDPGEPCYVQNSIVKIYGWGFGPSQGNGKVYIGTGPMYLSDTGLELTRVVWTSLLIKAAVDVPPGAKGMQLYIWVEKDGVKTNASYGYPGLFILNQETCS